MGSQIITVNSLKFDRRIHRSWTATLISQKGNLLTLVGKFENEICHPKLGVIRRGTVSFEFYWLNRWYNVFRFHEPEGELRNYYCNLNMPPSLENGVLNYVDLEIDVLVSKNFETEVLDLDEFEEHSIIYKYSDELKNKTFQTLNEVLYLVRTRAFPFS